MGTADMGIRNMPSNALLSAVALASLPAALAFTAPALSGLPKTALASASPLNGHLPLRHASRSRAASSLTLMAKEEFADGAVAGGFSNKGEPPFQIRGFSLANLVLALGFTITTVSFYQYFTNQNSLTSLGFVHGLPIFLGGFALKYAEILPVEVESTPEADELFEAKATPILRKVKEDVTRHRYGDDAHLDVALEKLELVMPVKGFPQMLKITQSKEKGGELGFTMLFQSKDTPYKVWADPARMRKYESFFGGGVNAEVIKVSKEERLVAIKLVTGEASKGKGVVDQESGVSAGGALKMGEAEAKDTAKEEKREME